MVSGTEQKLKRSVKSIFHIWLLLCFAALLAFILYFNRLTTHTSLQQTSTEYMLYNRFCVALMTFRYPHNQAPFYYPAWLYGQRIFDRLHNRQPLNCKQFESKYPYGQKSTKNTKLPQSGGAWLSTL